ncbi:MAG: hypothetical protein R3F02_10045 [Thiolinea sp.]
MLAKIFQVTTLVLVAWLVIQSGQAGQQLSIQSHLLQRSVLADEVASAKPAADPLLGKINEQLESLAALQKQQDKVSQDRAKKELSDYRQQQDKITTLQKAYILVLEAETARGRKDAEAAVEKLKAGKELIWKSGSYYPEHKKTLQGLMKPVDVTLSAWAGGRLDKDSQAIYSVVQQVLSSQDK